MVRYPILRGTLYILPTEETRGCRDGELIKGQRVIPRIKYARLFLPEKTGCRSLFSCFRDVPEKPPPLSFPRSGGGYGTRSLIRSVARERVLKDREEEETGRGAEGDRLLLTS